MLYKCAMAFIANCEMTKWWATLSHYHVNSLVHSSWRPAAPSPATGYNLYVSGLKIWISSQFPSFSVVRSTLKSLRHVKSLRILETHPFHDWSSSHHVSSVQTLSVIPWNTGRLIGISRSWILVIPNIWRIVSFPQLIINQQGCLAATATDCQLTVFLLIETQKVENQRHDSSLSHHQGDLGGGTMTVTSHEAQKQDGTMNYPLANKHSYWKWP